MSLCPASNAMDRAVLSSCKHKSINITQGFSLAKAHCTYSLYLCTTSRLFVSLTTQKETALTKCLPSAFSTQYVSQSWKASASQREATRLTETAQSGSSDSHTLSVRVASQSGCDSNSLTMPAWPCSLAHISAVEPSSSWRLTSAPCASSACTMSILPWLTASIRAV